VACALTAGRRDRAAAVTGGRHCELSV
jgi:hypothetical protein